MSPDAEVEVQGNPDAAVEEVAGLAAAVADAIAEPESLSPDELVEGWDRVKRELAGLLRHTAPDAAWAEAVGSAVGRLQELARRDFDAALYLLLQDAGNGEERYSTHHALLCALVCEVCADWLEWPAEEIDTLVRAALTMNLSMTAMHDALARQVEPLSAQQREQVDGHAEQSATLLAASGLKDALWIEVVRLHHGGPGVDEADATAPPALRLARLLRRVDVYTAKLSRRGGREALSPAIAARHTCLDAAGQPDSLGVALLRKLGLYPPGSFVRLANGELGVVVRRGPKAHMPIVAALRKADGGLHFSPKRRDTELRQHAVVHGVTANEVKVRLNHLRNLALD
jgi:HD-GYP domain-containing protein (c-di-GMP phosphodiesterase class II)